MCNAQECKSNSFSAKHTHKVNAIPTISGHELLFISLDFMVQNDDGFQDCMMNILTRL